MRKAIFMNNYVPPLSQSSLLKKIYEQQLKTVFPKPYLVSYMKFHFKSFANNDCLENGHANL